MKSRLCAVMVLLLLNITAFAQHVPATRFSLKIRNVTLKEAFLEVEKATGLTISYPTDRFNADRKVSLSADNITVAQAMERLLNGTGFSYTQKYSTLVLQEQKAPARDTTVAPGKLRGRIVDFETSQPLPGATLQLDGTSIGGMADEKGFYTINNVPVGSYTMVVSYIGYQRGVQSGVNVMAGKESVYDVKMQTGGSLNEVVIAGGIRRLKAVTHTTDRQVLQEIRSASTVVSGISSEQISKTGDRNAAQVIQRVSGATTVDDRFVIVRGLNQRYNLVYLNDNIAPSTEVYSRAFSLDLIPSRIIDRILVYKSPGPDVLADVTGGVVKIYTKDAREVRHFDIELQGGFRTGTTFDKMLTYKGGKFDWLGFDDGSRKLPGVVPGYGSLQKAQISQRDYASAFSPVLTYGEKTALPNAQLTANYYNAFRLGGHRVSSLTSLSYKQERQHSDVSRQQGVTKIEIASTGVSDRVYRENQNTENVQINLLQNFTYPLRDSSKLQFKNFILQQGQKQTIVRLSHENIGRSSIGYTNGYQKDIILSFSQRFLYAGNLGGTHYFGKGKHQVRWNGGYTFSRQDIPDQRVIRLETADGAMGYGSYIGGDSSLRWTARTRQGGEGADFNRITYGVISRLWVRNTEGVYNGSIDYAWTFKPWLILKAGTLHQWKERQLYRRIYTVNEGDISGSFSDFSTWPGGNGQYVDPVIARFKEQDLDKVWSNTYLRDDGSGLKVFDRTNASDAYKASEQNNSGYLAFSFLPAHRKVEVYGGLRVEYDRQKIAGAIPEDNTSTGLNEPVLVDFSKLSWLPSINISYRPFRDWVVRAAFGRTLNRPEFREISPYRDIDYENNQFIQGNPKLRPADIENYDLRIEFYPRNNTFGEVFSAGVFYKFLYDPIERINSSVRVGPSLNSIVFQNGGRATVQGLELEARKQLDFLPARFFRDLSVIANATFIKSRVRKTYDDELADIEQGVPGGVVSSIDRPLQGQAPYIVNAGLYYDNAGSGTRVSLIYNVVGTRIYAASVPYIQSQHGDGGPLYRGGLLELPRHLVDLSFTQRIISSLQMKLSVQNLLDKPVEMAEDYNFTNKYEPEKLETFIPRGYTSPITAYRGDNKASSFNPGRYIVISLSYSL